MAEHNPMCPPESRCTVCWPDDAKNPALRTSNPKLRARAVVGETELHDWQARCLTERTPACKRVYLADEADREIERLMRELAMSDAGGKLALAERDRLRAALEESVAMLHRIATFPMGQSIPGNEVESVIGRGREALSGEPGSGHETSADCSTGMGGVTLVQMAENIKHGVDPYTGDQMDIEAIRFLAAGQDDPQSMALVECANEIERLRAKPNGKSEGMIRSEVAAEIMDAIDELIKPGKLQGSGWDETAQRNGLILAYNTISQKFGEYRAPEASPLKADGGA